ncbi:MAG: stalk domain-containing protein [Clostridia bacterium]
MKKIIAFIFIIFLAFEIGNAKAHNSGYKLYLDDELVDFEQAVVITNGRMYAPARQIAEALGAQVAWKKDLSAMAMFVGREEWLFFTRETLTYRNGRKYSSEVKAEIVDNKSMLPVRFLGELFEMDVKYDPETKSTYLTSADKMEQALMSTNILGKSIATAEQMANYLLSRNPNPNISISALELAKIYLEEGEAEGIRGDFAFAQSLHETGNFKFGGDVSPEQNNFCGLGATGGVPGNYFESPRIGVRAQIQHLKAYACKDNLNNERVDPRWFASSSRLRGSAPRLEFLAAALNPTKQGWAYPGYYPALHKSVEEAFAAGETYGQKIHSIFLKIVNVDS